MINKLNFIIEGMAIDSSPSKANPKYAFDARNIRITAREEGTLLSITNEKGNKSTGVSFGNVIGYTVLDNYLVVFHKKRNTDYITRVLRQGNTYTVDNLFSGNLNFPNSYSIEALGLYENANIQKVYWVDGVNLPRVINIVKEKLLGTSISGLNYNNNSFNFVQDLELNEVVTVRPQASSTGKFSPGTILYAFTYYNKYGLESNIFYTTELMYITYTDRGASPDEVVGEAFNINMSGIDPHFDFIRIYSIHRSSLNATPEAKRVADIACKYYEKGTSSSNINELINTGEVFVREGEGKDLTPITVEEYASTKGSYKLLGTNDEKSYYILDELTYGSILLETLDGKTIEFGSNFSYEGTLKENNLYIAEDFSLIALEITYITTKTVDELTIETENKKRVDFKVTPLVERHITYFNYTDNNTTGEIIDPTLLLYIGGEEITASTLALKDNTLFLGNLSIKRPLIPDIYKELFLYKEGSNVSCITFEEDTRKLEVPYNNSNNYNFKNTNYYLNPVSFKIGEHYRLGILFQYKNGKWSEPIVTNYEYTVTEDNRPYEDSLYIYVPKIKATISGEAIKYITALGYKRYRTLIVLPQLSDRKIIALGMLCPTISWSLSISETGTKLASSWFSRVIPPTGVNILDNTNAKKGAIPEFKNGGSLTGTSIGDSGGSIYYRNGEIENGRVSGDKFNFMVDWYHTTFHSPDIEFDLSASGTLNFLDSSLKLRLVGRAKITSSLGEIDLLTSSPPIKPTATGFDKISIKNTDNDSAKGIVAGLFYYDYIADDLTDDNTSIKWYPSQKNEVGYMVYPWQCSGSLNNDVARSADNGNRSAVLKTKVISNMKFSGENVWVAPTEISYYGGRVFNSNELTVMSIGGYYYYGNMDTMLVPNLKVSKCIGYNPNTPPKDAYEIKDNTNLTTKFEVTERLCSLEYANSSYNAFGGNLGDRTVELLQGMRSTVRMKYKSSPHLVINGGFGGTPTLDSYPYLPLVEIYRDNIENPFGGQSADAVQSNLWIPSNVSYKLSDSGVTAEYLWGDCYYLRYDCLKTYPFTFEDENQIIEIASFLVETRVNTCGRYDKNIGNSSYLYVSPTNFNLVNPVYNLKDNFFNYRILDKDYYHLNTFNTSITWSKTKSMSETIDTWTNVTLANTLELDGECGELLTIKVFNNELFCFLNIGLSNILFNSRVLIATSDNVPIEINNGLKVDGKRYVSNSVGSKYKWSINSTPSGIYFIDTSNSCIYRFNGLLNDISTNKGFTLFTGYISNALSLFTFYDKNNGDVYFSGNNECLCYSERLNEFTSFMDCYKDALIMFNIGDRFYAINKLANNISTLWELFEGEYNKVFGVNNPYSITVVANQGLNDKTFNNLEIKADILEVIESNEDEERQFNKNLKLVKNVKNVLPNVRPFTSLDVWNEYLRGSLNLTTLKDRPIMLSPLKLKFRIWRATIPRDNTNKRDRIRNPWAYIKLYNNGENNYLMLLHDLSVYYFE